MKTNQLPHVGNHLYDQPTLINYKSIYQKFQKLAKEVLQRNKLTNHYDFSDTIINRRMKTIDSWRDAVIDRYKELPGFSDPYLNISMFTRVNFSLFGSINIVEYRHFILLAAALWYLDQVTEIDGWREKIASFLPTDESVLDSVVLPEIWHPRYDTDLIRAVVYVFMTRYGDKIEIDGGADGADRAIINSENAKGCCISNPPAAEDYKSFTGLISLIPQCKVEILMEVYKEKAMEWLDRLYRCLSPYIVEMQQYITEVNRASDCYEVTAEEMEWLAKTCSLSSRKAALNAKVPPQNNQVLNNPLLVNPSVLTTVLNQQSSLQSVLSRSARYDSVLPEANRMLFLNDQASFFMSKDGNAFKAFSECLSTVISLINDIGKNGFLIDCTEYIDEVASQMVPLDISNPYALCFAFLMLVETGDDFPWLCGLNVGFLNEIATHFPWSTEPYHTIRDDFWPVFSEEEKLSEGGTITDDKIEWQVDLIHWREKKYGEAQMSLEQILYKETGCVLPQDITKYQRLSPELEKMGISSKDTEALLILMAAFGQARRQLDLPLPDEEVSEEQAAEVKEGETTGDIAEAVHLQEEINALWAALRQKREELHKAEIAKSTAEKEREEMKEERDREHQELADLRSLVFSLQKDGKLVDEPDVPVEAACSTKSPYEVQASTLVFGGHDSWKNAIKPMLTGNVRFIDKDYLFNTNIIKNADMIWIQTNAISHKMYYRIVDTARVLKKPIRYFSNASASKCADQVMAADRLPIVYRRAM